MSSEDDRINGYTCWRHNGWRPFDRSAIDSSDEQISSWSSERCWFLEREALDRMRPFPADFFARFSRWDSVNINDWKDSVRRRIYVVFISMTRDSFARRTYSGVVWTLRQMFICVVSSKQKWNSPSAAQVLLGDRRKELISKSQEKPRFRCVPVRILRRILHPLPAPPVAFQVNAISGITTIRMRSFSHLFSQEIYSRLGGTSNRNATVFPSSYSTYLGHPSKKELFSVTAFTGGAFDEPTMLVSRDVMACKLNEDKSLWATTSCALHGGSLRFLIPYGQGGRSLSWIDKL